MEYIFWFCCAACVTTSALIPLRLISYRIKLVDLPTDRKRHVGEVVLCGGIGVILVFLTLNEFLPESTSLATDRFLLPLAIIFLVGLIDDLRGVSSINRLFAQIISGAILIFLGGFRITSGGEFMGHPIGFGGFDTLVTMIALVAMINAFNMLDGIDGLCAGQGVISCLVIVLASVFYRETPFFLTIIAFVGCLIGFLFWNFDVFGRGKVFLGDAGSTAIGFMIFIFCVETTQGFGPAVHPIMAAWALVLPICEVVTVVLRRIWIGKNPLKADRLHLHHLLIDCGWSSDRVAVTLLFGSCVLSLLGFGITLYFGPSEGLVSFGAVLMLYWRVETLLGSRSLNSRLG